MHIILIREIIIYSFKFSIYNENKESFQAIKILVIVKNISFFPWKMFIILILDLKFLTLYNDLFMKILLCISKNSICTCMKIVHKYLDVSTLNVFFYYLKNLYYFRLLF